MVRPLSQFDALIGAHLHQHSALRFQQAVERLGSGQRINRAKDDPSGLIASEHLRSMLAAIDAESRSLERSVHITSTADGVLDGVSGLLVAAKGIAIAREGAMTEEERAAYDMEWNSIRSSIDRLLSGASFNGESLFTGDAITLEAAGQSITLEALSTGAMQLDGRINAEVIDQALGMVSARRAEIGSFAQHTIGGRLNALRTEFENIAAANSRIADTDYAAETGEMIRARLLSVMSLRAMVMNRELQRNVVRLLA